MFLITRASDSARHASMTEANKQLQTRPERPGGHRGGRRPSPGGLTGAGQNWLKQILWTRFEVPLPVEARQGRCRRDARPERLRAGEASPRRGLRQNIPRVLFEARKQLRL